MDNQSSKPNGRSLKDFEPLFNDYPAEKLLLEKCLLGVPAIISTQQPKQPTKQNTVRATFLRFLTLGGDESAPVSKKGVQLWNACIEGELNFNSEILPNNLGLSNCQLNFIDLRDTKALGSVSFLHCDIKGLNANRIECRANFFLKGGCTIVGSVCLFAAQIDGDFECDGSDFNGMGDDALNCERAVIKGNICLRGEFTAIGTVNLMDVKIGGSLICRNGHFIGNFDEVANVTTAIIGDRAKIDGGVYLDQKFTAKGGVRLLDARIGSELSCDDGKFSGEGGEALICEQIKVKGSVGLSNGFNANGAVNFMNAQIDGSLTCSFACLKSGKDGYALAAENMTVTGTFSFHDLLTEGFVALGSSKVGSLILDFNSWILLGTLGLDGFVYDRLVGKTPTDAKPLLAWLDKQSPVCAGLAGDGKDFKPQPWRQLQKVLREMGHIEDARQVGIAFEERLRKANLIGQTPENWWQLRRDFTRILSRGFHCLFGSLIGYGYRPLGLFFKMFVVWFVLGVIYWLAAIYGNNGDGVFAPNNPLVFQNSEYCVCVPDSYAAKMEKAKPANAVPPTIQGAGNWYLCEKLRAEYTGFSPFAYSLDLILPLVDLQQENDWAPMIPTATKASAFWTCSRNWEYAIRFLMWFEILFGWVASLLLVAVVSGLTKRRDE